MEPHEIPQHIVEKGFGQLFDYGIGMSCLALFLLSSLTLNVYLLRIVKSILPLLGELKEALKHD